MKDAFSNHVMDYLTARRMSSLGNMAMHFECPVSKLVPVIKRLELKNRLRLSLPRCGGTCGSCDGCEPEPVTRTLPERAILISLEKKDDE